MKISYDKPPVWEEANKLFKLEEQKLGSIFTYGDTVYNPFGISLTDDLVVHEETHSEQQKHNDTVAKLWWQRFLADPEFRVDQEVEAYGNQYRFLCTVLKDRNSQARALYALAGLLSSPMYGSVITRSEAVRRIKAHSLTRPKVV